MVNGIQNISRYAGLDAKIKESVIKSYISIGNKLFFLKNWLNHKV